MANLHPIPEAGSAQSGFVEPQANINLSEPDVRRTGDPTIEAEQTSLTDHSAQIKIIMDSFDTLAKGHGSFPEIPPEEFVSTTYFNQPFADLALDLQNTILSLLQKQMIPGLSQTAFFDNTLTLLNVLFQHQLNKDPDTAHLLSLPVEQQQERMDYYQSVANDLQTRYPSVFAEK